MKKTHKNNCFKYLKQCTAILLVVFVLLNMLFVGMGKISLTNFWLGILFIGGASWIFYRDQSLDILGRKEKKKKNKNTRIQTKINK